MKTSFIGLIVATAVGVYSQIVDTEKELICNNPHNPHDCYPRLFEPTDQWQVIREDQDIPPGLHVRLNIDTLTREAKLMDSSEDNAETNDLIVTSPVEDEEIDLQQEVNRAQHDKAQQQIEEKIQEFRSKERSKQINGQDLNNYQGAVNEVESFDGNYERLDQALNTLEELSHDIEFGVKLTATPTLFEQMKKIVDTTAKEEVQEKVYRIMGSSLRNNPEAVTNALKHLNRKYVVDLFSKLSNPKTSDIIQKRVLGIIQSLAQNDHFILNFFNGEHDSTNQGITLLVKDFPNLGEQSKQRFLGLFEDLQLVDLTSNSNDRRSVENSNNPNYQISQFLQSRLANNKITSNEQMKVFFNSLCDLHGKDKQLKPSSEYLNWLAEEVETRKDNKKREDYSEEDKQFDEQMLKARHEVFGNPRALRKAMNDEL